MKTKTLYDRLKPEHKAKLDIESENYPSATRAAVKELTKNYSILDLTFGSVQMMAMYLGLKNANIETILDLFES